jgi:hypothetical protein
MPGAGGVDDGQQGCYEQQQCGQDGWAYWLWATYPDGSVENRGTVCLENNESAPEAILTPGRILEAFRRIPVPSPELSVQPPGGRTLVNFDTIFHTDTEPFTETVTLLGRQVTFDIKPAEFTWHLGNGETMTTTDPGRPWRQGLPMSAYVTHRYLDAGDRTLRLTTTWTADWRVGGGTWQPVDGTVTTNSPTVPLDVVTARPKLVGYHG